jgi:hypothetical protein
MGKKTFIPNMNPKNPNKTTKPAKQAPRVKPQINKPMKRGG